MEAAVSDLVIFFLGQSVIILGAIVATYVKIKTSITTLDVEVKNVKCNTSGLRADHVKLSEKVDGVSRHVAKLDGRCLAVHHRLNLDDVGSK